jgi:hypothetical protein
MSGPRCLLAPFSFSLEIVSQEVLDGLKSTRVQTQLARWTLDVLLSI